MKLQQQGLISEGRKEGRNKSRNKKDQTACKRKTNNKKTPEERERGHH